VALPLDEEDLVLLEDDDEEEEVDLVEEDLEDIFGCGLERKAEERGAKCVGSGRRVEIWKQGLKNCKMLKKNCDSRM